MTSVFEKYGGWRNALYYSPSIGNLSASAFHGTHKKKLKRAISPPPPAPPDNDSSDIIPTQDMDDFNIPDQHESENSSDDDYAPSHMLDVSTVIPDSSIEGLCDAPFLKNRSSAFIQNFIDDYENMPLCENSPVSFSELVEMPALLRYRHYDLNDTIMASIIGIIAAVLPGRRGTPIKIPGRKAESGKMECNVVRQILGRNPSLYRALGPLNASLFSIHDAKACVIVHVCRRGCSAFIGQAQDRQHCAVCTDFRYKPCRRCGIHRCGCDTKRHPHAVCYFFPLQYRLKKLLHSWLRPFLCYPHWRKKGDDSNEWWTDIYDGTTWQWFEEQMGPKERFIGLVVCSDGMDMFNKSGKSTNPVQVVVMNLPLGMRHVMHVGMFLWALDKGTDGALEVITEELLMLWHQGIAVDDIVYRVAIVSIVLDGKGLEKVKKQQGNGSYAGCTDCEMDGMRFNDAMCIYGHRR